MGEKLLEKVFSIKNDKDGRHKVVKLLGTKIKFKKLYLKNKIEHFKLMHDRSLDVGVPDNLTLQIYFNRDCNCRCKFCSIHNDEKQDRILMPAKFLYEYFLPLYPKTTNICPTYGEITYGKEGFEYLSFINKNYPEINLFVETNGILFSEKWAQLGAQNLMRVNFSLNAINEEYFKKTVWEKDGVYPVIVKNIENYLNVLKENDVFAFKPSVSSVLNSTNYETVAEFVKMALSWKLQVITFFFDVRENNLNNFSLVDKQGFDFALTTLLELERILNGKIRLSFRLFMPTKDISTYEEKVNSIDIEVLKDKYSEIVELSNNMDIKKLYMDRKKLAERRNKKPYSYYEELTGPTFHQGIINNNVTCTSPWSHLLLIPDGRFEVCAYRGSREEDNIYNFIENDTINWKMFFNNYFYRNLRKSFKQGCYPGCMPNCPAMECITKKEYEKRYLLNERL